MHANTLSYFPPDCKRVVKTVARTEIHKYCFVFFFWGGGGGGMLSCGDDGGDEGRGRGVSGCKCILELPIGDLHC